MASGAPPASRPRRCASTLIPRAFPGAPSAARDAASSTRSCLTSPGAWARAARTRWRPRPAWLAAASQTDRCAMARAARHGIRARPQNGAALDGREPHQAGAADSTQVAARVARQHGIRRRRCPAHVPPGAALAQAARGDGLAVLLRRIAARWLLVRPAEALSPAHAAAVHRVEQDRDATGTRFASVPSGGSPAAMVASLARRFTTLVRSCGSRHAPRQPWPNWTLGWPRRRRAASMPARIRRYLLKLQAGGRFASALRIVRVVHRRDPPGQSGMALRARVWPRDI